MGEEYVEQFTSQVSLSQIVTLMNPPYSSTLHIPARVKLAANLSG